MNEDVDLIGVVGSIESQLEGIVSGEDGEKKTTNLLVDIEKLGDHGGC